MGTEEELKRIQSGIYRAYSQDGLWDMLFGWFLLVWQATIQNGTGSSSWVPGPTLSSVFLLVLIRPFWWHREA